MCVFGDAVDRGDVACRGRVSDRSAVRRPDWVVFTTTRLRELTCLAAEVDGEDVGVVVGVGIGFVV